MFLAQLIARTLEGKTEIAPRRASRFEPKECLDESGWLESEAQPASPAQDPVAGAVAPEPAAPRPRQAPPNPPEPRDVIHTTVERAPVTTPPLRAPAPSATMPAPPPATVLQRLERLPTPKPSPSAIRPPPQPASPAPPAALRELHTFERVEVDHAQPEIERRMEVLTREHVIERVAREAPDEAAPPVSVAVPRAGSEPGTGPARSRPAPHAAPSMPRSRRDAPTLAPAAHPQPPAPAIVQVTIGRVEVRGGPPASPRAAPPRPRPRVDLDDYLRRREQG